MRTTTEELKAEQWMSFFAELASSCEAPLVAVEVVDERLSTRADGTLRPLQEIGYDPKDAVLRVAVGGRHGGDGVALRHFISEPHTITIEESGALHPTAIVVDDASGIRTRIRLLDRPMPRLRRRSCSASCTARQPRRRLRRLTDNASGSCG